jgi:phosphoribosyl 1,2-cyclic phosphodiesterase
MVTITSIASSSRGNCYHITDGKTPLLIECGVPIKTIKKAIGFTLSEVSGCLVTHEHMDHAKSVRHVMEAGIDCFASAGTFSKLTDLDGHRMNRIESMRQFNIGTWTILPFDTVHDAAEPLGFLLASGGDKVLFATDTAFLKYRFKGLTRIMIECNYCQDILNKNIDNRSISIAQKDRLLFSHFGLDNVIKFLKANDLSCLKETWLLHLSDGNSNAKEMKRRVQGVTGKPVYICDS